MHKQGFQQASFYLCLHVYIDKHLKATEKLTSLSSHVFHLFSHISGLGTRLSLALLRNLLVMYDSVNDMIASAAMIV